LHLPTENANVSVTYTIERMTRISQLFVSSYTKFCGVTQSTWACDMFLSFQPGIYTCILQFVIT